MWTAPWNIPFRICFDLRCIVIITKMKSADVIMSLVYIAICAKFSRMLCVKNYCGFVVGLVIMLVTMIRAIVGCRWLQFVLIFYCWHCCVIIVSSHLVSVMKDKILERLGIPLALELDNDVGNVCSFLYVSELSTFWIITRSHFVLVVS